MRQYRDRLPSHRLRAMLERAFSSYFLLSPIAQSRFPCRRAHRRSRSSQRPITRSRAGTDFSGLCARAGRIPGATPAGARGVRHCGRPLLRIRFAQLAGLQRRAAVLRTARARREAISGAAAAALGRCTRQFPGRSRDRPAARRLDRHQRFQLRAAIEQQLRRHACLSACAEGGCPAQASGRRSRLLCLQHKLSTGFRFVRATIC